MKNLWTKIFIGVLIGILIGTALLITLYFVSVSLFWNQP
ncbi:putative membrane protein [Bacillus pseudomycoides]|nr:putative membrane protein [Bacillus pseudomycoides]AJI17672.1 putative membrane protein [Bacillus pseudomycoides]